MAEVAISLKYVTPDKMTFEIKNIQEQSQQLCSPVLIPVVIISFY